MGHYEERLEKDLARIKNRIASVSAEVDTALGNAAESLLKQDRRLASDTILGDHPINRATRDVEGLGHAFIARHSPSAGNLRFVSSVLRVMVALERIGDYAVSISREAIQLSPEAIGAVRRDIEMMSGQSRAVLSQAMEAFLEGNAELARGTMNMANSTRGIFRNVYNHLLEEGRKGSREIDDLFALLIVLYRLERISDQAKNICEETVFAVTGEMKQPKVFNILFVDEKNDCGSQMAEAIARRTFPDSGFYNSAGWRPAEKVQPALVEFMRKSGYELEQRAPRQLESSPENLVEQHVIVGLESGTHKHIDELPFRTVLLEWPLNCCAPGADSITEEKLSRNYQELVAKICDLMETLRGEVNS